MPALNFYSRRTHAFSSIRKCVSHLAKQAANAIQNVRARMRGANKTWAAGSARSPSRSVFNIKS